MYEHASRLYNHKKSNLLRKTFQEKMSWYHVKKCHCNLIYKERLLVAFWSSIYMPKDNKILLPNVILHLLAASSSGHESRTE